MENAIKEQLLKILKTSDDLLADGLPDRAANLLDENKNRFYDSKDHEIILRFKLKLAFLFIQWSRWNEAWNLLDNALLMAHQHETDGGVWDDLIAEIYDDMGRITFRLGDYESSKSLLNKTLAKTKEGSLLRGCAYNELAGVYSETGDLELAIEYLTKSIEVLEALCNTVELSRAYNNLSYTYIKLDRYDKSLEFALKAYAIAKEMGNKRFISFASMNASTALLKLGNIDGAREYYKLAQEALMDSSEIYALGCLYTLDGMIETEVGDFEEARSAFEMARDYLEDSDIKFYLARLYCEYAVLQKKIGAPDEARTYYKMALKMLENDRCKMEIEKVHHCLSELDKGQCK